MTEDLERRGIEELKKGVRPTTKAGGYEEVPREVIFEAARQVGLPKEDIPKVRIEDTRGGYVDITPDGKAEIVIPRREPKWKVPSTLRHEMAHLKWGLHSKSKTGVTWEEYIRDELGAAKVERGEKLDSEALAGLVLTLVLEDGLPKRDATSWVMDEARMMGVGEHSITSAKRWLRSHWKRLRELEDLIK